MTAHARSATMTALVAATVAGLWTQIATAADSDHLVFRVVMVEDEAGDPAATGKMAAEQLKQAMGDVPLKAVLVSECFEDKAYKQQLLQGLCAVLPDETIFGGATYGSFTQQGCTDFDAVCLLGIGGAGVGVSARLATDMGTARLTPDADQQLIEQRLHAAGKKLADELRRTDRDRLCVVVADAHSPKNQYLVEGLQQTLGKQFPITGGCANKNAGQTFVYFRGKMYADAAVALMLSGDFEVALSGRMANQHDAVIASAADGADEALQAARGEAAAVLAFNCAGRRSKLKDYEDELAAMQKSLGTQLPLFGCYCAGEMGPLDEPEKGREALCGGGGWHVMFTVISQPKK